MLPTEKTKTWELILPLISKLIWPIFIVILILLSKDVLDALKQRILMGSNVKIGQYFELGEIPNLDAKDTTITKIKDEVKEIEQQLEVTDAPVKSNPKSPPKIVIGKPTIVEKTNQSILPQASQKQLTQELIERYSKLIYLTHYSAFERIVNRRRHFRIRIETLAHDQDTYSKITKVVYHLHETFKPPVREMTNKDENFKLDLVVWGEFTVYADVHVENLNEPIHLERYLDIKPASAF